MTPADLPSHVDSRLWVESAAHCTGRDFLAGNSQTFLGRMLVYCPHSDSHYNASRYQLDALSPEAELWSRGFLHGAEPPPAYDENEAEETRLREVWLAALPEWHQTGDWPRGVPHGWHEPLD